jgi:hypothetical protein
MTRAAWYSRASFGIPWLTWTCTLAPLFFISRAADECTHQEGRCATLGRRTWLRWRRGCYFSAGCAAAGCTSTGITTAHRPPAARQHGISPRWRGVFLVKRKQAKRGWMFTQRCCVTALLGDGYVYTQKWWTPVSSLFHAGGGFRRI